MAPDRFRDDSPPKVSRLWHPNGPCYTLGLQNRTPLFSVFTRCTASLMPLIRLECSDDSMTRASARQLLAARDSFVEANSVDFEDQSNLCPRLPDDLPFFALPEQMLLAYEKHRETSELGHVFRIANGLHDFIDSVVVTGQGSGWRGAQAIARACCDPFHNELTRAARGSKPRLYFTGHDSDNDQLRSLSSRLAAGGYGDGPAESSWALIGIDSPTTVPGTTVPGTQPDSNLASYFSLDHLVDQLRCHSKNCHSKYCSPDLQQRLITTVGGRSSFMAARMREQGFDQHLFVPDRIKAKHSVLSPTGLLSSAFLGLDCIQLLVGAAAVNENFRTTPLRENLVLRYVAATNQFPEEWDSFASTTPLTRCHAWWAQSLRWFEQWIVDQNGAFAIQAPLAGDLAKPEIQSDLMANIRSGHQDPSQLVGIHVGVDAIRTDPFSVSETVHPVSETVQKNPVDGVPGDSSSGEDPRLWLPDLQRQQVSETEKSLSDLGMRQAKLTLPVIDHHSLGQFLQLHMLAAEIQSMVLANGNPQPVSDSQCPTAGTKPIRRD